MPQAQIEFLVNQLKTAYDRHVAAGGLLSKVQVFDAVKSELTSSIGVELLRQRGTYLNADDFADARAIFLIEPEPPAVTRRSRGYSLAVMPSAETFDDSAYRSAVEKQTEEIRTLGAAPTTQAVQAQSAVGALFDWFRPDFTGLALIALFLIVVTKGK